VAEPATFRMQATSVAHCLATTTWNSRREIEGGLAPLRRQRSMNAPTTARAVPQTPMASQFQSARNQSDQTKLVVFAGVPLLDTPCCKHPPAQIRKPRCGAPGFSYLRMSSGVHWGEAKLISILLSRTRSGTRRTLSPDEPMSDRCNSRKAQIPMVPPPLRWSPSPPGG
jgi:hypothetical protein